MTTRTALAVVLAVLAPLALGSCQEQKGMLRSGIASFRVVLTAPADLGTQQDPLLEDNPHLVTFDVEALDVNGQILTSHNGEVPLWLGFEGTFSRLPDENGKTTVTLAGGVARGQQRTIELAFGPTVLVVEDAVRDDAFMATCLGPYPPTGGRPESCTYAVGSSPMIYYRNPFVDEVQAPRDPDSITQTFQTRLQGKSVYVDHPRSVDGLLVVTGAYAQAFTVTDISPEAMARGYNHVYVYSFSRAKRNDWTGVAAGDIVIECPNGLCRGYLSGGVKEFVGFTELDFPVYDINPPTADAPECRCGLSYKIDGSLCDTKTWFPCPEPVEIDASWMAGVVEEGDPAGDLSIWSLPKFSDAIATGGRMYGTWVQAGATYVVSLYKDEARTELVTRGTYAPAGAPEWPQTIQLAGTVSGSVVARGFSGDNQGLILVADPYYKKLESLEAALVYVRNARVCSYNEDDWASYGQIRVDFGSGCNLSVAFKGIVANFDPLVVPGQTIAEVIGTLRNLSDFSSSDPTQAYSSWILSPRAGEDVDCGEALGCSQ